MDSSILHQHSLDPADTGRRSFFFFDDKVPQIPGILSVGAAADLFGEISHGVDLDLFTVFVIKQTDSTLGFCFSYGHLFAGDGKLGFYLFVYQIFHCFDLFGGQLAGEAEVETQALCRDVAAFLLDGIIVKHLTQCSMEQMGSGMQGSGGFLMVSQAAFKTLSGADLRFLLVLGKCGLKPSISTFRLCS